MQKDEILICLNIDNEESLRVRFGDNPPLSFSDRIVVDFEDDTIIIRDSGWEIYLDTRL